MLKGCIREQDFLTNSGQFMKIMTVYSYMAIHGNLEPKLQLNSNSLYLIPLDPLSQSPSYVL